MRHHGRSTSDASHRRGRSVRMRAVALVGVVALAAAACGGGATTTLPGDTSTTSPGTAPAVTVVATTTIIGDLATAILGDEGTVEVLMPVGADPHDFSASSRQVALLQEADLVIANGLLLEEGLIDILEAIESSGTPVLWLAEMLDPIPFGDEPHDEDDHGHGHDDDGHGHDDDDDGHGHGEFDPHVWMDPARMATATTIIATELSRIAPDVDWDTAARAYADALLEVDAEILALVSTLPEDRRLLVTNHDSLGYFAARYGFTVVGTLIPGGTTLGAPSPAEMTRLVELIEDLGIRAIFAENVDATGLASAIAAEVGHPVKVVVLTTDSLGEPGSEADTLLGMLRSNARLIVEALTG